MTLTGWQQLGEVFIEPVQRGAGVRQPRERRGDLRHRPAAGHEHLPAAVVAPPAPVEAPRPFAAPMPIELRVNV